MKLAKMLPLLLALALAFLPAFTWAQDAQGSVRYLEKGRARGKVVVGDVA